VVNLTTGEAAIEVATGVARRRYHAGVSDLPVHTEMDAARQRFVVCGDTALTLRLVDELVTRYAVDVTMIVGGPRPDLRLAAPARVRVVEAPRLTAEAFAAADLAHAQALALVAQDDAGNLDAALLAAEINPALRIVVRMFNQSLAAGARVLLRDCAVLSESAIAAPGFVAAALGDGTPTHIRIGDRRLIVTRRADVRAEDVVQGLATLGPDGDELDLLPEDDRSADVVLAEAPAVVPVRRRRRRHPLHTLSLVLVRRLRVLLAAVAALLLVGAVLFHQLDHLGWGAALYVTVLTAVGGANPDVTTSGAEQALQTTLMIFSVALVPVLTAAVVDAAVRARLARATGGPTEPMRDHLVVVGLGNLGTRVLTALDEAGVNVVAIDHRDQARGVPVARALGIPVVVGDPTQEAVLRAAWVHTCRALLVLSTDDLRNLETALLGRAIAGQVRVVLRLFDTDFATRVERAFGLATTRSVSYLAAPAFAAAMMGRAVLDTIPVRRHVLLAAELPIGAGSALDGQLVTAVDEPNEARLLAVRTGRGEQTLWSPPRGRTLVRTDKILVVTTRTGLGRLLGRTTPPAEDLLGQGMPSGAIG
jgi:Trk K+ transport system NAD-binding subunit